MAVKQKQLVKKYVYICMYMFVYVCICINCIYVVLSYVGGNKESIYLTIDICQLMRMVTSLEFHVITVFSVCKATYVQHKFLLQMSTLIVPGYVR